MRAISRPKSFSGPNIRTCEPPRLSLAMEAMSNFWCMILMEQASCYCSSIEILEERNEDSLVPLLRCAIPQPASNGFPCKPLFGALGYITTCNAGRAASDIVTDSAPAGMQRKLIVVCGECALMLLSLPSYSSTMLAEDPPSAWHCQAGQRQHCTITHSCSPRQQLAPYYSENGHVLLCLTYIHRPSA